MRQNLDCIRDILFTIEDITDGQQAVVISPGSIERRPLSRLGGYDFITTAYHLEQCAERGYLLGYKKQARELYFVRALHPSGHEFLENIRLDTVWNKTKEKASAAGTFALNFIEKIAAGVVEGYVKAQLSGIGGPTST